MLPPIRLSNHAPLHDVVPNNNLFYKWFVNLPPSRLVKKGEHLVTTKLLVKMKKTATETLSQLVRFTEMMFELLKEISQNDCWGFSEVW
jgi:hypothetical protein